MLGIDAAGRSGRTLVRFGSYCPLDAVIRDRVNNPMCGGRHQGGTVGVNEPGPMTTRSEHEPDVIVGATASNAGAGSVVAIGNQGVDFS